MSATTGARVAIAEALQTVLPEGLPFRFSAYDGSTAGPRGATISMHLANERGLSYVLTAPGDLGMARAYVAGDLIISGVHPGDPYELLRMMSDEVRFRRPAPAEALRVVACLGWGHLKPPPPPPQEHQPRCRRTLEGRRHSRNRDATAISRTHHVSNALS